MDAYPFSLWLREVGRRTLPWSAWVYVLAGLTWAMTTSLALCTANWFWKRRRSLRSLGEVLVHLGFLLIFAGFVVEAAAGTRVHGVVVAAGETADVAPLGLALRLEKLELTFAPDGEVLDTVSTLTLLGGDGSSAAGTSRLNHPLISGATVVYPRGHRRVVTAVNLLVPGGALRLTPHGSATLSDGRRLVLRGVLQPDEERGGLRGPAIFVALADGAGGQLGTATLAPLSGRNRAELGALPVVLGEIEEHRVGRYDVHHDPGVRLVLVGAALLFAGTLWAFGTYLAAARLAPAAAPVSSSGS
jgi:hypothetical protein